MLAEQQRGRINLTERPRAGRYGPGVHLDKCDDGCRLDALSDRLDVRSSRATTQPGNISPRAATRTHQALSTYAAFLRSRFAVFGRNVFSSSFGLLRVTVM